MLLLLMLRSSHHRPTERLSLSVVLTDRVPKLIILDATMTDTVRGEFEQTHTDPHGRGAARSSGRELGWLGGISGSAASEAEAAAVASLPRSCSIYRSIDLSIDLTRQSPQDPKPHLSPFEPTLV